MSGSAATPFIVPFIMVGLAIWLVLVFYVDAHPRRDDREIAIGPKATQADTDLTAALTAESGPGDTDHEGVDGQAAATTRRAA